MMKNIMISLFILVALVLFSCTEEKWEEHYENIAPEVNQNIWDTLKTMDQFSEFVRFAEILKIDTLMESSNTKTLFIPTNEAFEDYLAGDTSELRKTMLYHISTTLFMLRNVTTERKLKTLSEKFVLIKNTGNTFSYDGVEITDPSPIYKDGKYYTLSQVVKPKPNLYEFIKLNNSAFLEYVDQHDSVFLNKEESVPLGFNEEGQTIYDSVYTIVNMFEEEFFPISKEFRDFTATMIIPSQEQYNQALQAMAEDLGGVFRTYKDIPTKWQYNVLLPELIHRGIYSGSLESSDFLVRKLANIVGDSIKVDFFVDPGSKFTCSNGVTYEYDEFSISDTMYYGENIMEAEDLVYSIGSNRWAWIEEEVIVTGETQIQPKKQKVVEIASNDTVVDVPFGTNWQGEYAIEFEIPDIFPAKYRFVWRSSYRTTGKFAIYVNGELQLEYDTYNLSSSVFSVSPDIYKFWPEEGFNQFDFYVTNIVEYGDVHIKIEYLEPGKGSDNGLNIDYIALIPELDN